MVGISNLSSPFMDWGRVNGSSHPHLKSSVTSWSIVTTTFCVTMTILATCSYNKVGNTTEDARWSCENPDTLGRDLKQRIGFRHGVSNSSKG